LLAFLQCAEIYVSEGALGSGGYAERKVRRGC
jgi:hypothetical protein